jgi:hypothetical protein
VGALRSSRLANASRCAAVPHVRQTRTFAIASQNA